MTLSKIRRAAVQSIALALALSVPGASFAQVLPEAPMGGAPQLPGGPTGPVETHRLLVQQMDSLRGEPQEALQQLESLWSEYASSKEETPAKLASQALFYSLLSGEGRDPIYKKLLESGFPEPTAARLAGLSERWTAASQQHEAVAEALDHYASHFNQAGAPEPPKLDLKKASDAPGTALAALTGARFAWPDPISKVVGELDALELKDPSAAVQRASSILSDKGETRLEVRVSALRTLGKLPAGRDKLVEHSAAMAEKGSTEPYYLKREAAKLLAENAAPLEAAQKKEGAVELLKKLYADANASVRLMAGAALKKFGVEPGPEVAGVEAASSWKARLRPSAPRPDPGQRPPTTPPKRNPLLLMALASIGLGLMLTVMNPARVQPRAPVEPPAVTQTADPAPSESVDPQTQAAQQQAQEIKKLRESNERLEKDFRDMVDEQKKEAEAAASSRMWGLLLQLAIPILFLFLIMKSMSKGPGAVMSDASKIKYTLTRPKVTFNDVAGVDEAKAEVAEIVDFLRDPARYVRQGARVPKGVILHGPPGTGKTMLVKAVANAADKPFLAIKGSDFVEMFVGVGAARVRALFEQLRAQGGGILFIDEFDAIAKERGAKGVLGGHDERDQTINAMLAEMDGFEGNDGIVVFAATNRLDVLDEAVMRPGRFDRKVEVTKPNILGREAILAIHGQNKRLAPEVDLRFLANRTVGHSGADLENVMNEGAILTARAGKDAATMEELNEAVDKGRMGLRKDAYISPEVKRRIAVHEIGHTVANLKTGGQVNKVTIVGRGNVGGFQESGSDEDKFLHTERELRDQITILLGSAAAEKTKLSQLSTGAENDLERANKIARAMVRLGMSGDSEIGFYRPIRDEGALGQPDASPEMAARIDRAVQRLLNDGWLEAQKAVAELGSGFDALVDALVEKETLTREQIEAILAKRKPA